MQDGAASRRKPWPKLPRSAKKWPRIRRRGCKDLRSLQKPLKENVRVNLKASKITIRAQGDRRMFGGMIGRHRTCHRPCRSPQGSRRRRYRCLFRWTFAWGSDGLSQITGQMVAADMGYQTEAIEVTVAGDLDLRGTLHIKRRARRIESSSSCNVDAP